LNRILLPALLAVLPLSAGPRDFKIRLSTAGGAATLELPLERYVAGVLGGESSVFRSGEALKAMAVVARTYAVRMRGRHAAEGFDFCSTTHCQRLDLNAIAPRLETAVTVTEGELLWYEGKPAFTPYSRDCGARTEAVAAVWPDIRAPYLGCHDDPYCSRTGANQWQWRAEPDEIAEALRRSGLRAPRRLEQIAVTQRTASGRASRLTLAGAEESLRIDAGPFRLAIGRALGWNKVPSDLYQVRAANGRLVFEGRGSGHGVGLCQRGADEMGVEGRSYREILAWYYPGAVPGLTARGLSWQRLAGDAIALATTQPDHDGEVLAIAERQLRLIAQRTGWPPLAGIEIRIYPDIDCFRNATGEPGWVAAHTSGRRVHMQPAAVLRSRNALESTVRHELLHVAVESQAAPRLPAWFREGLAGFLERPAAQTGAIKIPSDTDLRQTSDPARARLAYAQAAQTVAALVGRYGETTVFGWLQRGLPPELKNASASQPATKSR
jgi:stage II sporulation protein D